MKDTLKPGLSTTRRVKIDDARVIGFMGEDARVYATPSLVRDIEETCRNMLLEHLDEGEDSVGTRVEINHTAATPFGMTVSIAVTIENIDGRAVSFAFSAHDTLDQIADGRHDRFAVDIGKTVQRLKAKIEKAGG